LVRVEQKWAGEDATTVDGLYTFIRELFSKPIPSDLWSIQAAIAHWTTGIPDLSPGISNWFCAGTDWSNRANIIAVDWTEKTATVPAAVCASFLKGCP
jgi:hypothetical protein